MSSKTVRCRLCQCHDNKFKLHFIFRFRRRFSGISYGLLFFYPVDAPLRGKFATLQFTVFSSLIVKTHHLACSRITFKNSKIISTAILYFIILPLKNLLIKYLI